MSKATITIEGFISRDPELKYAKSSGKPFLSISVPHTPRKQENGQWVDAGDTTWFQATVFNEDAEYLATILTKGTLVTITAAPEVNVFQKQDGSHQANIVLRFPTIAIIQKAPKGYQAGGGAGGNQAQEPWGAPASTGWHQPPAQPEAGYYNDETPF
ncbi:single-stranded DNA-binding protein [Clavibacter sp. VKM Ac-2872]|uniref:single-stranded DNA-binding protein n=1 Tax=Clavibacter sp. VKM Ac-2872 TaxID=2783812 RepID=UPI00188A2233|nr:single-stranded DNA-binding protein [Clavibacter sp. VKM Ac-2872]MBF4625521.1 single-stranded DNA-binding protein [Clavibacter sp. VKM Ac-2872]